MSAHAPHYSPDSFNVEGAENWQELHRVSDATHAARVQISDFCGAWVALFSQIEREHAAALEAESERMRARKDKPGETAAVILAKVRDAYMALIGVACKADKHRPRVRRFEASAWQLESARRGAFYDLAARPKEEADRVRRNLSRYWREAWSYVFMFQRVTGLPLIERDARSFEANAREHIAASYTDRLSDLLGAVIADKRRRRAPRFRVERFELAARAVLLDFRRECEHECLKREDAEGRPCQRPHTFANLHDKEPKGMPGRGAGIESPDKLPGAKRRAKVISFDKGKKKLLEAVEILEARAERGLLTPEQAEEFLTMLAPVVEIAERTRRQSSDEDGVSSEDFAREATADESAEVVEAAQTGTADFSAESDHFSEAPADNFIRQRDPAEVSLDEFLAAFFPDAFEDINFRTFKPKGAPDEIRFGPRKWRTRRDELADELAVMCEANKTRGIYYVVNSGGDTDAEIVRVNAFFAEMDTGPLAEQHAKFDASPLSPGVRVETLKSVHGYWLAAPGVSVEDWREVQRRLIHYFGSDPKIKNPARVMRVPGFDHVSYNGPRVPLTFKPVVLARFDVGRRFKAAEMLAAFPEVPDAKPKREHHRATLDELTGGIGAYKRELGQRIMAHESARRNSAGHYDCRALCHGGKGSTGLWYSPADNFVWCNREPSCDLNTIAAAFGMAPYRGDVA